MNKVDKSGNLILVDCDGVLVDWLYSFNMWMENRGNYAVEGVSE